MNRSPEYYAQAEQWNRRRQYDPFCAMSEAEKRAHRKIRNWRIVAAVLAVLLVLSWVWR